MCELDENKATHIFTMPSELKPIGLARSYGNNGKSDLGLSMAQIDGDGNVIVTSSGTYASCDVVYMI